MAEIETKLHWSLKQRLAA